MRGKLLLLPAMALVACQPLPASDPAPSSPIEPFSQVKTGEACGGMMGLTCASEADFCNIPMAAICGAADGMGVCTPRPEMCTTDYQPVCGCGDRTYSNACAAAADGVSVAYEGECR